MPNDAFSTITITGNSADRARLEELMKGEESDFDFEKILPVPDEFRGIRDPDGKRVARKIEPSEDEIKRRLKKHGAVGGLDWVLKFWGTKWNAYCVEKTSTDDALVYKIFTAYSCPRPVFQELARRFPNLRFTVEGGVEFGDDYSSWKLVYGCVDEPAPQE